MRKQKEKLGKQSNSLLKQQKQKNKILRNAFTQIKDLYIKNYKTLMKEIKGDTNRWSYTMFMDQKNQYTENEYTTQNNL